MTYNMKALTKTLHSIAHFRGRLVDIDHHHYHSAATQKAAHTRARHCLRRAIKDAKANLAGHPPLDALLYTVTEEDERNFGRPGEVT